MLEHYITATRVFWSHLLLTCTSLSSTLMYLSRQTIYSDCAPYAAGILHLMRCAQWQLRQSSPSTINWTNCPFSTYIVVGFFAHKLRKGCTPPLLTKYTRDSWVMELLRHMKGMCAQSVCSICGQFRVALLQVMSSVCQNNSSALN